MPDEIDRRIDLRLEAFGVRLVKTLEESFRSQFGALDDKYRDIPARVTAVEDRVGITR